MTGQVSPFYLKWGSNTVYRHLNYVSGPVALVGECINGYHDSGKYYLTSNKTDLLSKILKRNNIQENEIQKIMDSANMEKKIIQNKKSFYSFCYLPSKA